MWKTLFNMSTLMINTSVVTCREFQSGRYNYIRWSSSVESASNWWYCR